MTRPTLLIVDDERMNRDLIRRVLHREYVILDAGDADAALAQLARAPVDVMVCDQVMPGRKGTELLLEVRQRYPRTALLLLTGYEDAPDIVVARRDGLDCEVVGKPWSAAQLREAIARALRTRVVGI
jgi:two-component system, NtrC family, response regulator HupR/HoxA